MTRTARALGVLLMSTAVPSHLDGLETEIYTAPPEILRQLSGLAPDDERLVRAVDRARDDVQAIVAATSPLNFAQQQAAIAALQGSVSAIEGVCDDLGV